MKELRLEASQASVWKLLFQGKLSLPAPCRNTPCFSWRLKSMQGAEREKFVHLLRLLAKREWFRSTSRRRWSHSQLAVAGLGCLWGAATTAPQNKWCPKATSTGTPLQGSSLQVNLISMPALVLKKFYFKCMWCLQYWQSLVCSCRPAQASPCHWGLYWFQSTILSFLSFCHGEVVLICEHM